MTLSLGFFPQDGSAVTKDGLSGSGRKSDSGLLAIIGVTNDNSGGS